MRPRYRMRRSVFGLIVLVVLAISAIANPDYYQTLVEPETGGIVAMTPEAEAEKTVAIEVLETLPVKGRAPKTGYARSNFGTGWQSSSGCDTRNRILRRDLTSVVVDDGCKVIQGILVDPYTGTTLSFSRGTDTSALVQIDHVVALSDAWQKGAQMLSFTERVALANDPLELLAVEGDANQLKSDGDAATWLPSNKPFRCQYVARQIAVKRKYRLWVTTAEHEVMKRVLTTCPNQMLPVAEPTAGTVS